MIYCIIILFFFIFSIGILSWSNRYYKIIFFISCGVLLSLIAGLRGLGLDRDYGSYVDAYNGDLIIAEPTFVFITWIVKSFFADNVVFLFVIYAFLGVFTKFLAIKQLTEFWFLSIVLYISYSFTLHEMTQIRIGVAVGILLLCIRPLYERNLWLFLFFSFLAVLFHFSIFFIFLLWFIDTKKFNKIRYASFIVGAYILNILFRNQIASLLEIVSIGGLLEAKFLAYQFDNNSELNIFNAWQLLRIALSFLFIYKIDVLQSNNVYSILLTKIYVFATCIFVLLSFNPAFAARISDILSIVDIILIPFLVYIFNPRFYGRVLVLFVGIAYLYLNLFYNKILN